MHRIGLSCLHTETTSTIKCRSWSFTSRAHHGGQPICHRRSWIRWTHTFGQHYPYRPRPTYLSFSWAVTRAQQLALPPDMFAGVPLPAFIRFILCRAVPSVALLWTWLQHGFWLGWQFDTEVTGVSKLSFICRDFWPLKNRSETICFFLFRFLSPRKPCILFFGILFWRWFLWTPWWKRLCVTKALPIVHWHDSFKLDHKNPRSQWTT